MKRVGCHCNEFESKCKKRRHWRHEHLILVGGPKGRRKNFSLLIAIPLFSLPLFFFGFLIMSTLTVGGNLILNSTFCQNFCYTSGSRLLVFWKFFLLPAKLIFSFSFRKNIGFKAVGLLRINLFLFYKNLNTCV